MPSMVPVGPYEIRHKADGAPFPYYIIPFDKDGRCEGPLTREHLLAGVADKQAAYTDIFVFSHGWNNDWETATNRYNHFVDGFIAQRTKLALDEPTDYRPLLVGIFWPSQAMAWFESEKGPRFAGTTDVDTGLRLATDIAGLLPDEQRETFLALVQRSALTETEARQLATLLASVLAPEDEGLARGSVTVDDLLAAAKQLGTPPNFDEMGGGAPPLSTGPAPAGLGDLVGKLDPRNIFKPFTVWLMKDRAGVVGSRGVSPLLHELLARSQARIHLLGHSFGCKVVMSATATLQEPLPRKIHSALLLQPAISQYAFSEQVPDSGLAGGYLKNLLRIERPVVATFSADDVALCKTFHVALRRKIDLGEQPVPAGGSPSKYGALGGFGPQEPDATVIPIKPPGERYDFRPGKRLIGVDGTGKITGHGEISNNSTWWLAYCVATST